MKIALGQIEVVPGNPEKNVGKMLRWIEYAKENECDLIAFPEMSVGGYLLGDLWLDDEYCRYLMSFNDKIKEASDGIAVAFGNVYLFDKLKDYTDEQNYLKIKKNGCDGRAIRFNAAYLYQNQQTVKNRNHNVFLPEEIQPKILLPNYRIFDDERYFTSPLDWVAANQSYATQMIRPFEIDVKGEKVKVGLELCEDLWHEDYNFNPTKILSQLGSKVIINLSASPWTYGKNGARDRRVEKVLNWSEVKYTYDMTGAGNIYGKHEHLIHPPFFYVNCVGVQNNGKNIITFDGGSTVYGNDGKPRIFAKDAYQEELIICNDDNLPIKPIERKEETKIAQKYKALCRGIKAITDITNTKKFVIGLSGGIDSAVAACLLVDVVGKDNVMAINMPTENNSINTKNTAKGIASKLNIRYEVMPIQDLYVANRDAISKIFSEPTDLNLENEQARIRSAMILAGVAARENALFTNNGNKLEAALGYCTYLGDMSGSISILGDILKTEVFELAEYINQEYMKYDGIKVIPDTLFPDELYQFGIGKIASGPELLTGQISKLKIGYHDFLVAAMMDYKKISPIHFLRWYLNGTIEEELSVWGYKNGVMKRYGLDNPKIFIDDLAWFSKQYTYNVWKRIQAPPVIITSKTSFGYDLRESQLPFIKSELYLELEKKILQLPATQNSNNI